MSRVKKIAVLGGTFDPIHNGHIHMADEYNRLKSAELTLFVPVNFPPHKKFDSSATNEDRMTMCKLALEGKSGYRASDIDYRLGGKSYSVNTLKWIKREYGPCELSFIIGADMLMSFESWYEPQEILRLASLAVLPRSGISLGDLLKRKDVLSSMYQGADIEVLDTGMLQISSSGVRECVKKRVSIEGFVPQEVERYIMSRQLYKEGK